MPINLRKGESALIDNSLKWVMIGLGWDPNPDPRGQRFDLDLSAFLCGANGKALHDEDVVFYNKLKWPNENNIIIEHSKDDETGEESDGGDDEWMKIDFTKIPAYVQKIVIIVTIFEAEKRRQNFGQVSNSFVRFVRMRSSFDEVGQTLFRFDLEEEFPTDTAMLAGEICRTGRGWEFNAIANGYRRELKDFCPNYGVRYHE